MSNAAFGLEVAGVGKKERERRAMEVLEQVGLATFAHKLPSELSGGMQQRVGLARALAVNPSLMIMDEAFSALDPLKRKEMQNVLLQLQKEQRRTIMFVSHDLEEALRIGNRIAIMEGGRLVQVGTPQDIIANPADDYVRTFFDGIDTSRYLTAGDLMQTGAVPLVSKLDPANVAATLNGSAEYAFVLDAERKIRGFVTRDAIGSAAPRVRPVESIRRDASLDHVVARVVASPNALPSIMQGVNQTIMMALSMVIIASMVGAGGLGKDVLASIQRLDIGLGFESGLSVVLLAIILDRLTESFGRAPGMRCEALASRFRARAFFLWIRAPATGSDAGASCKMSRREAPHVSVGRIARLPATRALPCFRFRSRSLTPPYSQESFGKAMMPAALFTPPRTQP